MRDFTSPKDLLKSRRPSKFSDSMIVKAAMLNRSVLEQHLETLTTRNQEAQFAEFGRKLCQLEICPNLRPQTGPVGGGDSKVDSESIPVSSQTQLAFYYGEDNQSRDSFAFAFSAKKAWTGKARSDVRKVHGLGKGYKRIYFVTNQPARDKTRAEIEKELTAECGVKVVILDKNWILDRVFTNKREKLAIEELDMGSGLQEIVEIGPLDLQRRKRLQELNASIEEAISKDMVTYKVVGEALDTALLTKELDAPRTEVEGQFERAIRFARRYGNKDHLFTALYERAWATFFWFEDFAGFIECYDEVELLAFASLGIFSAERLSNLWSLLRGLAATSKLVSRELLRKKFQTLEDLLTKIIANEVNPSASVQAEAILCLAGLVARFDNEEETGEQFTKLRDILERANVLIGFPFEAIVAQLTELDIAFSGVKEFEELQEYLIEATAKRRGEIPAGKLLFQRGVQHLRAQRLYKAIDCLGRSLYRFHKHESRDDLVIALMTLAHAYEEAGLLWAARSALINAASHATSKFWIYNKINAAQVKCYEELGLLEVRLGRIGAALDWHSVHMPLALQIAATEKDRDSILNASQYFGGIMGLLTIKSREDDLKAIEKLPDMLSAMELDFAAFGLAYRLGGKDNLPPSFPKDLRADDPDNFFSLWLSQPAQQSLPEYPEYYLTNQVQLHSRTLGCDFRIETSKDSPEIEVAEYILAALESFLSTAIAMDAVARDSGAVISISRADSLGADLSYEFNTDGKLRVEVLCGNFNPHSLSKEEYEKIHSKISEIVLHLIARAVLFRNPRVDLEKLFKDEEVASRAFSFSSPLVSLGNVFGQRHKRSIIEWIVENKRAYSYVPGSCPLMVSGKLLVADAVDVSSDDGSNISHAEIRNNSIIRINLWDRAGWRGVFYLTSESYPPVMGFVYKDKDAAGAIFQDWKESLGEEDKEDIIRIKIARGIDADHPAWYRIGIGTKLDAHSPSKRLITVTRLHTMQPDSPANLDRFLASFKRFGVYFLAPAIIDEGATEPTVLFDLRIMKHEFIEKHAWEIGTEDLDISLITPEDINPVIPSGVIAPPVLETLEKIKSFAEKRKTD